MFREPTLRQTSPVEAGRKNVFLSITGATGTLVAHYRLTKYLRPSVKNILSGEIKALAGSKLGWILLDSGRSDNIRTHLGTYRDLKKKTMQFIYLLAKSVFSD